MGIFSRFKDIVNSNINAILDKAEDPEKLLKLMMQEMEDTLIELKSSCAAKMAHQVRLEKKLKENEALVNRWQQRAELAVQKGRDDLAREALVEKRNVSSSLETIKGEIATISDLVSKSKGEIHQLEDKLEQSQMKLKTLQQKARAAEEERRMHSNMSYEFDNLAEKIDRLNAENELYRKEPTLDDKFRAMEVNEDIEKELEALKKKENK